MVTLWDADPPNGKYFLYRDGVVLFGPFFSHVEPMVVAQQVADSTNRPVCAEHPDDDHGTSRVFWPNVVERVPRTG
jgi:hypothetical protein